MAKFKGKLDGNSIIIPVIIVSPLNPNDEIKGKALIDTGSTTCSVRQTIIDGFGLSPTRDIAVASVVGNTRAKGYNCLLFFDPKLVSIEAERKKHSMTVTPLPLELDVGIDAIIGMDFIKGATLLIANGRYVMGFGEEPPRHATAILENY